MTNFALHKKNVKVIEQEMLTNISKGGKGGKGGKEYSPCLAGANITLVGEKYMRTF